MPRRPRRRRFEPRIPLSGHFGRDGRAKTPYPTQLQAEQAARATWAINGIDLQTYRCDVCHLWHNGRSRGDE